MKVDDNAVGRGASNGKFIWMGGKPTMVFLGAMIGLLGIGLGYPGQPHVLNRYMAAKDSKTIERGTWIAFGWGFII